VPGLPLSLRGAFTATAWLHRGNAFFGGLDRLFLKGTFDSATGAFSMGATFSKATPMYELVFVAFQATFAAITVCLILGAIVERIKFSAVLIFSILWFTLSYVPVAHMVWFWMGPDAYTGADVVDAMTAKAGYIWQMGALDFAGGTVVHINAGVAGLVGAYMLGKRVGYGKEAFSPHSLTMTMIGASLLWFGWFGAGSALEPTPPPSAHQHLLRHRRAVLARRWVPQGALHAGADLALCWPAATPRQVTGVRGARHRLTAGFACRNGLKKMLRGRSLHVFGRHGVGGITGAPRPACSTPPTCGPSAAD
jgi:Amt family ammonium transporter